MSEQDVKVVFTGNYGPNAFQTLNAAGIEVMVGVSGKVADMIERFKLGSFSSTQAPNVVSHFGMGNVAEASSMDGAQFPEWQVYMGRGIGRRGRGGGMGRGMGSGQGSFSAGFQPDQDFNKQAEQAGEAMPSSKQKLDALKAQALAMKQKLQAINERIAKIEGGSLFPHPVAVVNAEKCTACRLCEGVCPVAAIKIDTVAIIDRAECTGCGQCVAECPRKAITLKKA